MEKLIETFLNNIQDGVVIMLIGMGVVFLFLTIMVFVMDWTSKLILKLNEIFPEEIEEEKPSKKTKRIDDSEVALAIAIACAQRRV